MNYKITNGLLLLRGENGYTAEKKDLYVRDGVIASVGCAPEIPGGNAGDYEMVDASDHLVMPGLINMHTHAYMTVMRNYADDVDFAEWLFNRCMPVEDRLPQEAAYWTTMLGLIEMIRTGTTCFVDMHMYPGQSPKAVRDAGMRAYIGRGLVGEDLYGDGFSRFSQALEEKEAYESEMIRFVLSPHAIYSASPRLYAQVSEEAEKRGMLKQTHLSESETEITDALKKYGKTPVQVLVENGFIDRNTILAHCVQMRGNDMELLAKAGAHVVTNPASNAKLGNGFAPVTRLRKAGINVCLGTDGAASNNTLNLFREMGLLTIIHKGIDHSSTSTPSFFVLDAATVNAARALHRENELGVIREGAAADLAFVDLNAVSLFPPNNVVSSLCYSANGSEVDSLMAGGKFLMRNRKLTTIDEERVYAEVREIVGKYL